MDADKAERLRALRREPPPLRRAEVAAVTELSPYMKRIVLTGAELESFAVEEPASSVRILVPTADSTQLELPTWNGNAFELPTGERAPMRTFTPRAFDPTSAELTVDFVLHDQGVASDWARTAAPGDPVAVSGPGRGESLDPNDRSYLLAGDETAIPAIGQLIEAVGAECSIEVHIEIREPAAQIALGDHPGLQASWHVRPAAAAPGDELVDAIAATVGSPNYSWPDVMWIAGEAKAIHRIRTILFDEHDRPRSSASVRGYWKHDR